MSCDPKYGVHLDRLLQQFRHAPALDANLMASVVSYACTRLPLLKKAGKAAQIDRLIDAGAWSDAALALIEIELPGWKLRRVIYDDGEWFCSLSRQPNLPVEFDDTADARHEILPLAILMAFVEARRAVGNSYEASSTAVPELWPAPDNAVCCDNFT